MESDYTIVVADTDLLSGVCGTNDSNLRLIEDHFGVPIFTRGNELTITAENALVRHRFHSVIDRITEGVRESGGSTPEMVSAILRNSGDSTEKDGESCRDVFIQIPGGIRRIYPKTGNQAVYMRKMRDYDLIFCTGPAGSGKTFIAVAEALRLVLSRQKRKLVLTRPVVEAGENLGFLPGDLEQKINPYLRPLLDSIEMLLSPETIRKMEDSGVIEIAPLAYMRGRTLTDCVVILDEAQNTTKEQMKMFLTRMGEGTRMIITGDITQTDLPSKGGRGAGARPVSGLSHATDLLDGIEGILVVRLEGGDVVRNPLIRKIIQAYENDEQNQQ
ncbi:MAG: PhoH family protein [Spirochaetaceae bacterium]|nr:PhoH family protein [Spirochaetaceae bacterium]